jgi:hypothetical protein
VEVDHLDNPYGDYVDFDTDDSMPELMSASESDEDTASDQGRSDDDIDMTVDELYAYLSYVNDLIGDSD